MDENVDILPRSVSDALMQYRDLREHMEGFSLKSEPLNDDVRERMQTLAGWLSPETMAQNLAAALRALWCAVQSRELSEKDQVNTLWLLAEWSDVIADTVFVKTELDDCLSHDERLRAGQKKPGRKAT